MIRRGILGLLCFSLCFSAKAQSPIAPLPNGNITFVVPFAPGGPTDVVARQLGMELAKSLGRPVIIDNKPGAGSRLGVQFVARAKPDGLTLLVTSGSTLTSQPAFVRGLPYDPLRDFEPISQLVEAPLLLSASTGLQKKNMAELIDYAKNAKESLMVGTPGLGSAIHLSLELLKTESGLNLTHVPYKGSAPAVTALLSGEIQLYFDAITTPLAYARAEKIKPIAVTTANRFPLLPDVPTMAEAGFPTLTTSAWFAILAPKGTPKSAVAAIDQAVAAALRTPNFMQVVNPLGFTVAYKNADTLKQFMAQELDRYMRTARKAGIEPQDAQ
jgi:tripartite-type tricarboxylate transporter receptor subunit TctC